MKIKIKHILIVAILAASTTMLTGSFVSAAPQTSTEDPVLAYCKEKAKKVKDACPTAAKEAKNIASYKCATSKKPKSCIRDKAKAYIKKAASGNPSDAKFKTALDKIFDKEGGDRTKPADATADDVEEGASVFGAQDEKNPCGGGTNIVYTKFNFGCIGPGPDTPEDLSPIMDLVFSFIRFFSTGVGLVLVASIIYAGIQYSTSEGNPETTRASKTRIKDAFIGLLIYIFAFSLIQYLVPGGVFH